MKAWVEETMPFNQKLTKGVMLHDILSLENNWHYTGTGVTLDRPDRPILLWYKRTGAANYRVIHADLNVKEMTPEEVRGFS